MQPAEPATDTTTNYKGKTNQALAEDFLAAVELKQEKTKRHWRILLNKYKAWDREGVADILHDTVLRIYHRILEHGFTDGYFQAYLERALENNLLNHIKGYYRPEDAYHLPQPIIDAEADEEAADLARWERQRLDKMLFGFNQLSEAGQEMLVMVLDDQRYWEIRKALNLTIGQVKMRIRKARTEVAEYQQMYPVKMWESIQDAQGHSVSRTGFVRDDASGLCLRQKKKWGAEVHPHYYVELPGSPTGILRRYAVHELVYHYHGDTHEVPGRVYHLDGNPLNNHVDNLYFEADVPGGPAEALAPEAIEV